jgi:hypothetical protein
MVASGKRNWATPRDNNLGHHGIENRRACRLAFSQTAASSRSNIGAKTGRRRPDGFTASRSQSAMPRHKM